VIEYRFEILAMPKKRKPATPRRPAPKPLPERLPPNPLPIPVRVTSTIPAHLYEVRPRKDKRGVDLTSDVLPFGRLWYGESNAIRNAIGYAEHRSHSHDNLGNNEIVFADRNLKLIFSPLARRYSSRLYVLCR
jgi:hypothetical protein